MQLSPLQSRLAASLLASFLLILLYVFLFSQQFAFAADSNQFSSPDALSSHFPVIEENSDSLEREPPSYEPSFSLFDRSAAGRRADDVSSIELDRLKTSNIDPGSTVQYVFEASSVSGRSAQEPSVFHELRRSFNGSQERDVFDDEDEATLGAGLRRRQRPSQTLYISANTCNQPGRISPDQTTMDPPQLTLFVSTSKENTSPGPGKDESTQKAIVFTEGAVMYNASLNDDVYFSISAPHVSEQYFTTTLPYNYEVAVSVDQYHHAYEDTETPPLYWVDSDASSTLLITKNLTSTLDDAFSTPPYVVFVQNTANPGINGIRNSYCGLKSWAQIRPLGDGDEQATVGLRQGKDDLTVQEFYFTGLNASSTYTGIAALNTSMTLHKRQGPGSRGSGLVVYKGVDFSTKPNGACTFVFNLTLCTETRYAVPGNSEKFPNGTALAAFYDNYTRTMWDNFDKVLQQTPCQAPPTQRYSLVKDCDSCKAAYKNWLCSVAIPRCEDFSAEDEKFLHMRNVNAKFSNGSLVEEDIRKKYGQLRAFNSSRNLQIDDIVQPGPYKERLPCDYLCYELVRSCPASMGFACPLPSSEYGFNTSYATNDSNKPLSCNYPGSAYYPSIASATTVAWSRLVPFVLAVLFMTS
ncbi:stretch-activated Ca2+-permeable channel component-domain-containing protein [Xylariaceae sp. FL0594]|nr:stretch-activated Ca2+-permeable channel component-domain-containing protein [Xylariaceae sp. FL0594]